MGQSVKHLLPEHRVANTGKRWDDSNLYLIGTKQPLNQEN